jgi:hypothetical protein
VGAAPVSTVGPMTTDVSVTGQQTTLALKEWGAVAHALLQGRQTLLLRKGGIHEKAFTVGEDRFVLFPTVAHSHAERVRDEHRDLLGPGAADVAEDGTFTVRVGIELFDVIRVERPEALEEVEDLHIWTTASVRSDRVDFRPKHRLQALVVRAHALDEPVTLPRLPEYGGCTSWVDLPVSWPVGTGRRVVDDGRLAADAARVRDAIG